MNKAKKEQAKSTMLLLGLKIKSPGTEKIKYKNPIKTIGRKAPKKD